MSFSLKLFGGASLTGPSGQLGRLVAQRHRLALLALLTAPPVQAISRDKLIALLWPERDAEHARGLLNQAVYALRQALGPDALRSLGDGLEIDLAILGSDVLSFEEAIASGDFEQAVALYRGPFLDGFFLDEAVEFERWVEHERNRLAGEYALALERLATAEEGSGQADHAVKWWQARAAHDPCDSRVAMRLIEVLERVGNRAGALQHALAHVERLREDMGIDPPATMLTAIERLRGPAVAPAATDRWPSVPQVMPAAVGPAREPLPATPTASAPRASTARREWWIAAGALATVGVIAVGLRYAPRGGDARVPASPAVVDEIAKAVARELERRAHGDTARVGPQFRTRSIPAYELYLRGNDPTLLRSESGARQGLEFLRRAVALDSTYAAAWAGLARMTLRVGGDGDLAAMTSARAEGERAARRAVALDDSLAEAHAILGMVRAMVFDLPAAEEQLRRAIALEPARARHREWLADFYLLADRPAEALSEAEHAVALEPLSPSATAELARALLANDRCDEALAKLEPLAALDPPLLRVPPIVAQCYGRQGRWADAVAVLRPRPGLEDRRTLALLGYTLARAGEAAEARAIQATLVQRWRAGAIGALDLAYVPVALGELDEAFVWLDRAVTDGSLGNYVGWRVGLSGVPFDDLSNDPRLAALHARIGLQKR